MRVRRRLKYRVAAAFAAFGGILSLLQATGMYVASVNLEERLIDDTLTAELQDYTERRARNPRSVPEMTATIRTYVLPTREGVPVPSEIIALPPGRHQIFLKDTPFRAVVATRGAERYVILFNESQARRREQGLVALLAVGVLVMSCLSALLGFWLAGRIIAPVTDLVKRVAGLRPEDKPESLAAHYPWDEIHELALDFDAYLSRLGAFIERERAFTSDVSHELRTPLAVVKGAAEVLLTDPHLPQGSLTVVERLARAAEEMTEITASLLVLAREEQGDVQRSSCEVETVVHDVVKKLREPLKTKPITLTVDIQARPRLPVECTVLAMVVSNLLRNALAYTDQGEVRLHLDAGSLTVTDSGIGIEPGDISKVFDRYYRSAQSRGAGIGLSLVKRICDRCGWGISIHSEPGQGTTTILEF